jgi:hypothetical protein
MVNALPNKPLTVFQIGKPQMTNQPLAPTVSHPFTSKREDTSSSNGVEARPALGRLAFYVCGVCI